MRATTLARRSVFLSSTAKFVSNSTSDCLSVSGSSLGCDRRANSRLRPFLLCPARSYGKRVQGLFHHAGDRCCQIGRYGIADLLGNIGLAALEHKIVRKSHEAGCLPVSDGSVLHGMKIPSLFGLEKLRTDGDGRSIPPQPSEKIRSARCFLDPASRRYVTCVSLQIETIAAGRNSLVTLETCRRRIAPEMQVQRRRCSADFRSDRLLQVADGLSDRTPGRKGQFQFRRRVSRSWREHRSIKPALTPPDYHGPLTGLRCSVVGSIKDGRVDFEPHPFCPSLDLCQFLGAIKLADVLHDEKLRTATLDNIEVGLPESTPMVADP